MLLNILLVEDDPDDIELMLETLKENRIQFSLESIKQGDKVIPYLEMCKNFPNIIVLDLNLPKMHGREVLERLKSSERFKGIPIIILTTSSAREDKEFCLRMGADKFLTKPSTVEGFNKTISAIVDVASQHA